MKVEPKEETIQPPRPKPPKELKTTNDTGDGEPISLGDTIKVDAFEPIISKVDRIYLTHRGAVYVTGVLRDGKKDTWISTAVRLYAEPEEETESDAESQEDDREVKTYWTPDMSKWLTVRLDPWLPIYAKWQIYFIAKSIRDDSLPLANPEKQYYLDDKKDSEESTPKPEVSFKLNILRSNPRAPVVLRTLRLHVAPEFQASGAPKKEFSPEQVGPL